jgi:hypothetical protein
MDFSEKNIMNEKKSKEGVSLNVGMLLGLGGKG